jgi:hypothetical protein
MQKLRFLNMIFILGLILRFIGLPHSTGLPSFSSDDSKQGAGYRDKEAYLSTLGKEGMDKLMLDDSKFIANNKNEL